MTTDDGHLDLDALADVLTGEAGSPAHLTACADCRAALEELRSASAAVSAQLAALPPPALPAEVAAQLTASWFDDLPAGTATVTTLPQRPPAVRWLPAAAAVLVLLAGVGYGISRLGGSAGDQTAAMSDKGGQEAAPGLDLTRNSTGSDYDGRTSLAAAVPGLLGGTATAQQDTAMRSSGDAGTLSAPSADAPGAGAKAAADALAPLRTDAGLAECLLALLPPDDPSVRPLALDYASFRGTPALVVVLPSAVAGKLDVFVVGATCSRANDSTLFYTSVDAP